MTEKIALTVAEAAELTGLCTKTIYTLSHRADFPAVRIGRTLRINRKGLERWFEDHAGVVVEG